MHNSYHRKYVDYDLVSNNTDMGFNGRILQRVLNIIILKLNSPHFIVYAHQERIRELSSPRYLCARPLMRSWHMEYG